MFLCVFATDSIFLGHVRLQVRARRWPALVSLWCRLLPRVDELSVGVGVSARLRFGVYRPRMRCAHARDSRGT